MALFYSLGKSYKKHQKTGHLKHNYVKIDRRPTLMGTMGGCDGKK